MHSALKRNISAGDEIMWNSRKYTAMAVVGVGLAVAAATPASAQLLGWGGAYGGGCGSYAFSPVFCYPRGLGGVAAFFGFGVFWRPLFLRGAFPPGLRPILAPFPD